MTDNSLQTNPPLRWVTSERPVTVIRSDPECVHQNQKKINDLKEVTRRQNARYLADHPEIRAITSMLVQTIMLKRPQIPLEKFCYEFFCRPRDEIIEDLTPYLLEESRLDNLTEENVESDSSLHSSESQQSADSFFSKSRLRRSTTIHSSDATTLLKRKQSRIPQKLHVTHDDVSTGVTIRDLAEVIYVEKDRTSELVETKPDYSEYFIPKHKSSNRLSKMMELVDINDDPHIVDHTSLVAPRMEQPRTTFLSTLMETRLHSKRQFMPRASRAGPLRTQSNTSIKISKRMSKRM